MMAKSFEPGAPAGAEFIPLTVPEIRGHEWQYVKECLDTNWVSSVGPFVDRFEQMTASYVGCRRAVATVNGTAALHVALRVAGVRAGDEVLVSDLTFIAPVNAVRYLGAWPVLIDAEPDYWQIDPQRVREFLDRRCQWSGGELRNRETGRRVSAILPVDILGHSVDMDPILETAKRYKLPVVEDATESLGAKYKGKRVGSLADVACFSYNGNKIITTGGGGMIVTNNEAWADKAKYLTTQAKDDPLEYVHHEIGYNYRLTNVLAAIGVAQMERLDEYVGLKRRIAQSYSERLRGVPGIRCMAEPPGVESTYWMYTVLVDAAAYGRDSRQLLKKLQDAKIQARPLWQPMHASPAHADLGCPPCPIAERLHREALSLPCSVGIAESQIERVTQAIRSQVK